MSIEDEKKGPLFIKKKAPAVDSPTKLHIKGREGQVETSEDQFAVGKTFINRDMNSEFTVMSAEGEPGRRHIVLKETKGETKVGKGEQSLLEAIENGVWKSNE